MVAREGRSPAAVQRRETFARVLDRWFTPVQGWWPRSTGARIGLTVALVPLSLVAIWFTGIAIVSALEAADLDAFPGSIDRDELAGDGIVLAWGLSPLVTWSVLGLFVATAMAAGSRALVILGCTGLLAAALSGWFGWYAPRVEAVERYCRYGAVSQAQYDGCVDHVSYDQVQRRNSSAGRYGRGNLHGCLEDAGPLCTED